MIEERIHSRCGLRGVCQLRPLYGMRGVRVGEASNPGPVQTRQARRLGRLEQSDEEIMVRPNSGRHVIPRRTGDVFAVASRHNRRLVLTSGTLGEPQGTVPALPQCAELHCADREEDDCSSVGSESRWGEREDVVEWGALPVATRRSRNESGSNRFATLADEEIVPGRARRSERTATATLLDSDSDAPLLSGTVSGELLNALEENLMQPVFHQSLSSDRVCGGIPEDNGTEPTHFDLTVADSLGEEPPVVREHADAGQERRQQLSESDTESVGRIRRRRLVLQFEPDPAPGQRDGSEAPHDEDAPFATDVPLTNSVRVGLESLDVVNLESVFEIRGMIMKSVPKFMRGVFRGAIKTSLQAILR